MDSIRIKRGMSTELPKSLPLGELAFCIDTRELWVGSGDGLALKRVTNTEITQHLDEWNALYTEVDERFETKYVDVSAQFSEKFNELCQQFSVKSDSLDRQFADKFEEICVQFSDKYAGLEAEYAKKLHNIDVLSSDNKESIDLLKRDIGTTENIEDLRQINNLATDTLNDLQAIREDLESDISEIGDFKEDVHKAHIDYSGTHHEKLKDSMDANVDFIMGEFNSVTHTGEYITAQDTILRHIKRAELRGHTEVNLIQEPSGQDLVLPYEFEDTQSLTLQDTKESGAVNIVLKGNTEVNVLKNPMRDYVVPYEFEEGYTATLTDTKETGSIQSAILKGNTLVNLCVDASEKTIGYSSSTSAKYDYRETLKPNTTYTILFKISDFDENVGSVIEVSLNSGYRTYQTISNNGRHSITFTTQSDTTKYTSLWFYFLKGTITGKSSDIIVLEGDYANLDVPCFTGMQSVKMPVLTTTGKNLWNGVLLPQWCGTNGSVSDNVNARIIKMKVEPNTKYTVSRTETGNRLDIIMFSQEPVLGSNTVVGNALNASSNTDATTFTTTSETHWIIIRAIDNVANYTESVEFQIEFGNRTPHEPYKSNILTVNEPIELRGIGDVRDTLDCLTGEVISLVEEVVLNGSDNGVSYSLMNTNTSDYLVISCWFDYSTYRKRIGRHLSTLPLGSGNNSDILDNPYFGGAFYGDSSVPNKYVIKIEKSKLISPDLDGFKDWLSKNPVKVQYVVGESIKTVDLEVVDQDGLSVPALSTYNEVTHIDTTVPENSLKPLISSKTPEFPVMIKPNTKYSIVADTTTNGFDEIPLTYNLGGAEVETSVGEKLTVIQTPSTLENETFKVTGTGMKLSNVMILEKDLTGKEIPNYTEGMQSVKMPVLTTTGKNLVNPNTLITGTFDNPSSTSYKHTPYIKIEPNTSYSFRLSDYIYWYDENREMIGERKVGWGAEYRNYTSPINAKYVRLTINSGCFKDYNTDWTGVSIIKSTTNAYEPFKSNILTVNEPIELRGIGEVKDELNLMTGEMIQSVGVLNGEETGWQREPHSQAPTDSSLIAFSIDLIKSPNKNLLSSVLVKSSNVNKPYRWYISFNSWLVITLPKSEVTNLDEFKAWLKNNEVLYPLTEKSIKTVDFTITNQNGAKVTKLSTFNDVTYISTTVAEGALNPIISHKDLEYEVLLKPNTKYSIITNPISNGHPNSPISFDLGGQQVETTVGSYCTLVTTPNSLTHDKLVMKGRGNKLSGGVMIFEGDKTGMVFSHFDGMKSVENPTVRVNNKNLFDPLATQWTPNKSINDAGTVSSSDYDYWHVSELLPIEQIKHPNNIYRISYKTDNLGWTNVAQYDKDKKFLGKAGKNNSSSFAFNLNPLTRYFRVSVSTYRLDTIMIEAGNIETEHVPHQSNSLPLKIPMRSLPTGVCDTLDLITGEYVQRVYYQDDFANCNFTRFETQDRTDSSGVPVYKVLVNSEYPLRDLGYNQSRGFSVLCDVLKVRGDENGYSVDRGSYISTRNGCIFFHLIKEEVGLPTDRIITKQIFMDWLNVFPIKFCAELTEPIVTKLDLAWEDGKLFAYDGKTHFFVNVEGGHLQPVLDIDVPTDIVAELSRLRAEKTALETSKASLESQITLLDKHNKELVSQVKQLSETNTQLANETKSLRNQTRVNKNNLNYTKSYLLEGQKVLEFNQEELHQEQERTKTEQQVQDQQILSSMLASTEIFELVLALMPMQLGNERQSTEGGSKMVEVYVTLIIAGEKTLEQVPALVRPKVEAQLKAMGVLA